MKKLVILTLLLSLAATGCSTKTGVDLPVEDSTEEYSEFVAEDYFDKYTQSVLLSTDLSMYMLPDGFDRELENYVTQIEGYNGDLDELPWILTSAAYGPDKETLVLALNSEDFKKSTTVTYSLIEDKFLYYSYTATRTKEYFDTLKDTTAIYNVQWLTTTEVDQDIRDECDKMLYKIASNIGVGGDYKVFDASTSDVLTTIRYSYTANPTVISITYDMVSGTMAYYNVTRDTQSYYEEQLESEIESSIAAMVNRVTVMWDEEGPIEWEADDFRRSAFDSLSKTIPEGTALKLQASHPNDITVSDSYNSMLTTKFVNTENEEQYAILAFTDSYEYMVVENIDLLPVVVIDATEESTELETETGSEE